MEKVKRVVLRNATVLPMDDDSRFENCDVVLEDGRITDLYPTKPSGWYAGLPTMDCTQKFIIPGLWDMHVHLFNDEFLDYFFSWGVTSVLNMWGFDKIQHWRHQVEKGRRRGPDIYSTGPIIDSLPTYPLITVAETPQQAREAVQKTKADGYDFVKIYNNLTPEVYKEIEKTAKEVGLEVVGHLPNCANTDYTGKKKAYPLRQKTVEHVLFLNDYNVPSLVNAGVWLNPTFTVEEAYRNGLDERAQHAAGQLRKGIRSMYWKALGGQHKKPRPGAQKTVRKELEYYDDRFREYLMLGGKVLLGTDSGFPNVVPGYSMHQELQAAVRHGMSPFEALHSATYGAADFMGKTQESGCVRASRKADLLLLYADPEKDIANTLEIAGLFRGTRYYNSADLNHIRARARRRPEICVHTVFRSYMFKQAGQLLFGGGKKKAAGEAAAEEPKEDKEKT